MNKRNPFLTIGIASYNYAPYLTRAFKAICNQDYKDYEIIYADDGSKDNSVEIIESFIKDNPKINIKLVEGENGGVMVNKNRILDNATGEYIMLCDADDWMEAGCLKKLAFAAKDSKADRIVSEIRNLNEDGSLSHIQTIPKYPSKWNWVLHHGVLYKRAIIEKYNLRFSDRIPDDFCFAEKFNLYGETFFLKESVYNWWIHDDSTGNAKNITNPWRGEKILKGVIEEANDLYPLIKSESDRIYLEAEVIKYYYVHLIKNSIIFNSLNNRRDFYNRMHKIMLKSNRNYLDNPYLKLSSKAPFREKVHKELHILSSLERIHCLELALQYYGIVMHNKQINL